ncbi:MAG: hypothetical protein MUC41_16260 [Syntrophobacteraceae bacterium]|nr:hypothetical protein [Syntrophobacteraceae bacterium]
MEDALMAAFAMFSLKDSSLLQFDKRRVEQPTNLKTVYKLQALMTASLPASKMSSASRMSMQPHAMQI